MTTAELDPELRKRIDARLDGIHRVLMRAEIGWSERRSIVGGVETQVFELLARRSPTPTEEDVRTVLDSLDPPESYIPEELRARRGDAPVAGVPRSPGWHQLPRRTVRVVARFVQATLCAGAFLLANGLVVMIIAATHGVIPWLVTLGGLAWLNYMGVRWFRSWSATRQGHLLDDVRHNLAAWLMPKNGAQTA